MLAASVTVAVYAEKGASGFTGIKIALAPDPFEPSTDRTSIGPAGPMRDAEASVGAPP
jgi:hypothetical protein